MPTPAGHRRQVGADAVCHAPLQTLEEFHRQAAAGLTIGGGIDRHAAEVAQVSAGGIAVGNLLEEQIGRDHRPELAVAPFVAMVIGPAFVNRVEPLVFGMPFILAWLVGWVVLTSVIMAVIFVADPTNAE